MRDYEKRLKFIFLASVAVLVLVGCHFEEGGCAESVHEEKYVYDYRKADSGYKNYSDTDDFISILDTHRPVTGITVVTQYDADNINFDYFLINPNLSLAENQSIKNIVINVALFVSGFETNYNVWEFVSQEIIQYDLNELVDYDSFLGLTISEGGIWIASDFMLTASRRNGILNINARVRSWPREQPYLDNGSWFVFDFEEVNDLYTITALLVDA